MAGKQPDFHLYLSGREVPEGREKKRFFRIGAAWWNRDGNGMRLTLNPGMTIDNELLKEFTLGMFKNTDEQRGGLSTSHRKGANPNKRRDDDSPPPEAFSDDVPF